MSNILDTLITDRVPEDADYARGLCEKRWARMNARERADYLSTPKGAYGAVDMNRVVGAMEYLGSLMSACGVTSGYQPVKINHVGSGGKTWTDTVWIDYDKVFPHQWAAHLNNVRQFWAYVRVIDADIVPWYDPEEQYFIRPHVTLTAGDICTITACHGLLRLTLDVKCDPAITAEGLGWEVARTEDGLTASYYYPGWMFSDVQKALEALRFSCTEEDGVFDTTVTFRAELRYGAEKTLGVSFIRWSSHITWGGAHDYYQIWANTNHLDWWLFERGYNQRYPFLTADGAEFVTADGKELYVLRC